MSEEAPSFATDSKFGDLLVVVVPKQVGLSSQQCKKNWKWSVVEDQHMQEKLQYKNFPIICCTEGPVNLKKRNILNSLLSSHQQYREPALVTVAVRRWT